MHPRIIVLSLVVVLGCTYAPAAGLAQVSGQNQYGAIGETAQPAGPDSGSLGDQATGQGRRDAGGSQGAGDSNGAEDSNPSAGAPAGTASTLPFTGRDLLLALLGGSVLVGLGLALRVASRQQPTARGPEPR